MEVRDGTGKGHQQDTIAVVHGGHAVEGVTDGHLVINGHGCQEVHSVLAKAKNNTWGSYTQYRTFSSTESSSAFWEQLLLCSKCQ